MKLRTAAGLALALATSAATADDHLLITGAGATFPAPLYTKWFADYNKLNPSVQINYQAIGSGGGIKQITERTVDFGASDAPMSPEEVAKAPGVLHVPTVMGAVVVTWNEPSISALRLSPGTLAAIFLGQITRWNDPAIVQDNGGAAMPATDITVARRSDGSGTTYVFTDYLAKVSPDFKAKVGAGKSVNWPAGLGAKGNDGVTGLVKSTKGAIGYVELAYANQNHLPKAELKNHDGHFVRPTLSAISEAAAGIEMPADYRVSVTDAAGPGAWPIASFTYLLVRQAQDDAKKGRALVSFLGWALTEGQKAAAPLDYAPLPEAVAKRVQATVASIKVAGQ